ncbi:MAG: HD domain-containing protein [Thermomicrobiales bacterium]
MDKAPLEPFLPTASWFAFQPHGIHGVPHVTRVLFWTAVLTRRVGQLEAVRWRELFWAAAVHDVARVDDGIDRGHGQRAAGWVEQHLAIKKPEVASLDVRFIAELCRWHEVADQSIAQWCLELMILKDADGLDRCRIWDLDPARLRLQASLSLVAPAERLEAATDAYGSQDAPDTLRTATEMYSNLLGRAAR